MDVLVLIIALIPAVAWDLRRRIIPDLVVLPALAAVLVIGAIGHRAWWQPLASGALVALLLLVPALVRPEGMGMGDVKLGALIGAALGMAAGLLAVLAGLVLAAGWGFGLALARRARPSTVALPLAPFLAAGVLAVLGPAALVHSAHGSGHRHPPAAGAAVRPAPVGGWQRGRHPALAGPGARARAPHAGRAGARGGAPAGGRRDRGRGAGPGCRERGGCPEVRAGRG
ncbi:MAG: prepilin peptidase [Actinomycetota bacterium]